MNEKRKQNGFTLIEIILVLLIIAAILFFGINRYLTQRKTADIAIIKNNIDFITNALDQYYASNCKSNQTFTVSITDLNNAGLLPKLTNSALLQKFSNSYQFSVSAQQVSRAAMTQKPIYHFTISAALKTNIKNTAYYLNVLGASSYQGNTLNWLHVPSYPAKSFDRGLSTGSSSVQFFKEISSGASAQDLSCAY